MNRDYPLIEYARSIKKNTAEFTVKDMVSFMHWWLKQQPRKDLMNVTPTQQTEYNKDLLAMNKYRAAQQSRLPIEVLEQGIESPINDGQEEIVVHEENDIVCSMELSRMDVDALLFTIRRVFEDYEMEGHEYGVSLLGLKKGLEGL